MAQEDRRSGRLPHTGPYMALIKNSIDTEFQGRLEVQLIRGYVDDPNWVDGQLVRVRHVMPYGGNTSVNFAQQNPGFNATQKSYGMWMTPPDAGTTVMCIFIDGLLSQGFWIGVVTDRFTNQMMPGIGSVSLPTSALTQSDQALYGPDPGDPSGSTYYLPVAEINKKDNTGTPYGTDDGTYSDRKFPVHTPFATQLATQGLLYDRVRGGTSSSARRESPSSVFGISTPGPLDTVGVGSNSGPQTRNDYYAGQSLNTLPSSRLGGNTFVMDDGDLNGDNELIRLRTRGGLQLLLHNSKDLVYITNSQGTSWIEMTSNGKIDIYAKDSVSIHSETDFNLRAGRNFNIEAGQNINMKAFQAFSMDVGLGMKALVGGDITLNPGAALNLNAGSNVNVNSGASILANASKEMGLTGGTVMNLTAPATNIAGPIKTPSMAIEVTPPNATVPPATIAAPIPLNDLPYNNTDIGWANGNFFRAGSISTTMLRLPVHEPWSLHENLDTTGATSSYNTDNTPGSTATYNAALTASVGGSAPPPVTLKPGIVLAKKQSSPWSPSYNALSSIAFATNGTGDINHWNNPGMQDAMKLAVQQAADTYFQYRGSPVNIASSFRLKSEEQAFYDAWAASTTFATPDGKTRVTIYGKLTTPVNPSKGQVSPHSLGIAIDTPQAYDLYSLGILDACGLVWPLGFRDKNHVTLSSNPSAGE